MRSLKKCFAAKQTFSSGRGGSPLFLLLGEVPRLKELPGRQVAPAISLAVNRRRDRVVSQ